MKNTLLFFYITLFVHVFGQNNYNTGDTSSDWKTLSKDKFTIAYPSTWTLDESGQMNTSFYLISPLANISDNFKENVNLIVQSLGGKTYNLKQYVKASKKQIKTYFTNAKFVLNKKSENQNGRFQKLIYTCTQGDFDLKFEQYLWIIDNKAYILTLTCEADEFDNYKIVGEKILDSFSLK